MQKLRDEKFIADREKILLLSNTLKARNYSVKDIDDQNLRHPMASSSTIKFDDNGGLIFPVLFLYPEFDQSDFIAEFHEDDTFYSHFQVMFSEPAPWDTEHLYTPEMIEWFYESNSTASGNNKPKLINIRKSVYASNCGNQAAALKFVNLTLKDVLIRSDYFISNGVCVFVLMLRDSEYLAKHLK
jgi:hypothetical protein